MNCVIIIIFYQNMIGNHPQGEGYIRKQQRQQNVSSDHHTIVYN